MKLCRRARPRRGRRPARARGLLGVVAVVEDEQPLGEEEEEEAGADEQRHASRVVDRVDRLGQHVEQRDARRRCRP